MGDATDKIAEQWAAVRPDLDATPVHVVLRIFRSSRLLDQRVKEHFAAHGLESWEFDVLATLRRAGDNGTLRMSDLAGTAMLSPAALTNRVDRLVAKGLVVRTTHPDNRRIVQTSLTEPGRQLVDTLIAGHFSHERELVDGLTAAEQRQLASLLRKLLESLGDGSDH